MIRRFLCRLFRIRDYHAPGCLRCRDRRAHERQVVGETGDW